MIRNYKNQLALAEKTTREKFLELGKKYDIEYPSISVRELDHFSMFAENDDSAVIAVNRSIETAKKMKIPIILIPNFNKSEIRNEDQFKKAVKFLSGVCDAAYEHGITIAHESVLSPDMIERLIKEINRPNIRLYFDSQNHFLHGNYDMAELLERMMPVFITVLRCLKKMVIQDG